MKISEIINALNKSKEEYGDLDVTILVQTQNGLASIESDEQIYFNYGQYEDSDKLDIQNFPY